MKKRQYNNFIFYVLILLLITIVMSFCLGNLVWKFLEEKTNLKNSYSDRNSYGMQFLSDYGYVKVFNVTIDKTSAEIGENVTIETVYSFICNEGYMRDYGLIGINNGGWIDNKDSLIDGVEYNKVSEIFTIRPDKYNASDICQGMVKIKIININESMAYIIYWNLTNENLEIERAKLNYSIVEQRPLTIFSKDLLNFRVFIYNEHTKTICFSNKTIIISVINQANSLNLSKNTDSEGFLNFTLNCSSLNAGIYIISLKNDESEDYESCTYSFQVKVYDEDLSINCSLTNQNSIYADVDYDVSNNTEAVYEIDCEFEANINYSSSFCYGQTFKVGNQHIAVLTAPKQGGTYQIKFYAQPKQMGKILEFDETLLVEKRPIGFDIYFSRRGNQRYLSLQINVMDNLANHLIIDDGSEITILVQYNHSIQKIGTIQCNSSGIATLDWLIPQKIIENIIGFTFISNETQVYQFLQLTKNMTITNLEYLGPTDWIAGQNLTISAKLCALNGSALINHLLKIKINGNLINIMTDIRGEIAFSFISPPYATTLECEILFAGTDQMISTNLRVIIELKLDLWHQIWDASGYILISVSLVIISLIYLKKRFFRNNLSTLSID